jgi:hypothetical protein
LPTPLPVFFATVVSHSPEMVTSTPSWAIRAISSIFTICVSSAEGLYSKPDDSSTTAPQFGHTSSPDLTVSPDSRKRLPQQHCHQVGFSLTSAPISARFCCRTGLSRIPVWAVLDRGSGNLFHVSGCMKVPATGRRASLQHIRSEPDEGLTGKSVPRSRPLFTAVESVYHRRFTHGNTRGPAGPADAALLPTPGFRAPPQNHPTKGDRRGGRPETRLSQASLISSSSSGFPASEGARDGPREDMASLTGMSGSIPLPSMF